MCMECGCGKPSGNTHLEFTATGYNEENAAVLEKELLGLKGVMHVHIHAHNGETFIDYDKNKSKLSEIIFALEKRGVSADL